MWCQKGVRGVTKMATCGAKKGYAGLQKWVHVVPKRGTQGDKNGYMWCQNRVSGVIKMDTCDAKKGTIGSSVIFYGRIRPNSPI
jgi:hypothetical protein